jgi:hypothetical protein
VVVLRRRLSVLVAMVVLTLMLVATRDVSAEPPQPVDVTATLPGCDFPVLAEVSGKSKVQELPGGRTLSTSPGLRITLTNQEDTSNQVTYVITGSFLIRELEDGTEFVVARGRNLIFGPDVGMFLTIGRFTLIGQTIQAGPTVALTRPTGQGRLVDVCATLA